MPHDPIRAADTRAWLAKAGRDLKMEKWAASLAVTSLLREVRE